MFQLIWVPKYSPKCVIFVSKKVKLYHIISCDSDKAILNWRTGCEEIKQYPKKTSDPSQPRGRNAEVAGMERDGVQAGLLALAVIIPPNSRW